MFQVICLIKFDQLRIQHWSIVLNLLLLFSPLQSGIFDNTEFDMLINCQKIFICVNHSRMFAKLLNEVLLPLECIFNYCLAIYVVVHSVFFLHISFVSSLILHFQHLCLLLGILFELLNESILILLFLRHLGLPGKFLA